jgi:hypothetical protein
MRVSQQTDASLREQAELNSQAHFKEVKRLKEEFEAKLMRLCQTKRAP